MKLVIQRAASASVEVDGAVVGRIERGLVLLLGIEQGDTLEQVSQLATKVLKIRLWPDVKDPSKQWCSSVVDNGFGLLVVSQFTLFATFKKPKPDFHQAMGGDQAKELYEAFVSQCRTACGADKVATGVFGAMMQVDLRNDGPVTVELVAGPPALAPAPTAGAAAPSPAGGGAADAALEELLGRQPYVGGFLPSSRDAELLESFRSSPPAAPSTPHLARWFEHVSSFAPAERSGWA